jgi:uncharacterized membrane protein (DUF373 family)
VSTDPAGDRGAAGGPGLEPPATRSSAAPPPAAKPEPWADRFERALDAGDRWLHLLQDAILVGVAILMLLLGVFVLVAGTMDLLATVTLRLDDDPTLVVSVNDGPVVVEVAENALLALILAELVGTLLLSIRGRPLTIEPFVVIAIVAVVRHLLVATVGVSHDPVAHTVQLVGLGGLVLLLVGAVVLLRLVRARDS